MNCRHCGSELRLRLVDLGSAPPSNAYLTEQTLHSPEKFYPLRVLVCTRCWLVQTEDFTGREELFNDEYAYFSSFSTTWLQHARDYVDAVVKRFSLHSGSTVVEVAANDGYLLQFVQKRGIPCYGIEPTQSTASAARAKGVEIIDRFFGSSLARTLKSEGRQADLIVANNVLAHVPDIKDFIKGFVLLLKPDGVATFEFPHLLNLIEQCQFDTIYHEHFSYLSFTAVHHILSATGLQVFDVEKLRSHGGSLRVFAQQSDSRFWPTSNRVKEIQALESCSGINSPAYYTDFQGKVDKAKNSLLQFLLEAKRADKKVAAYGAAAKGNTLLNFAGIRPDLIPYVVDKNPAKQGKFLPGSRIPVVCENVLKREMPDFVLVLPWNLKSEVMQQLKYIRKWGGEFVLTIPELEIL